MVSTAVCRFDELSPVQPILTSVLLEVNKSVRELVFLWAYGVTSPRCQRPRGLACIRMQQMGELEAAVCPRPLNCVFIVSVSVGGRPCVKRD